MDCEGGGFWHKFSFFLQPGKSLNKKTHKFESNSSALNKGNFREGVNGTRFEGSDW